ncbi:MAG TPA: aminoacyl-tRNA hydrolase [Thiotrichales bacterium]|nr:aminoacyl-tRNA hydrolase [Thiotrichales bacterium]
MAVRGTPVRLVVGLGNPGPRYSGTRHNAGFWFVERLQERMGGSWRHERRFGAELCTVEGPVGRVWLLKPQAFMNHSGQAVGELARYHKLTPGEILVAHDDLDLPPGAVRLKQGGGHGGHNGLRDVERHLGSRDYRRLRIGIGHPGHRDQVVEYVLGRPSQADREAIETAIERAVEEMPLVLEGEVQRAMNRLHVDS